MDELTLLRSLDDQPPVARPDPAFVEALHARLLVEAGFAPALPPTSASGQPTRVLRPVAEDVGERHIARPWRTLTAAATLLLSLGLLTAALIAGATLQPTVVPEPRELPEFTMVAAGTLAAEGGRCGSAAVRLADGRVLLAGGWTARTRDGAPGYPAFTFARVVEVYDPVTRTSSVVTGEVGTGDGASATLLDDGRVLIAGGRAISSQRPDPCGSTLGSVWRAQDAAYLFEPSTGTITPTGPMTAARAGHAAVPLADGRVLIAGGSGMGTGPDADGGSSPDPGLDSAELYDPTTGTFSAAGSMSEPRGWWRSLGAQGGPWTTSLRDGRVLVSGGEDGVDLFDPLTATFSPVTQVIPSDVLPAWIVRATNCFGPCLARTRPDGTWDEGASQRGWGRVQGGFAAIHVEDPRLGSRFYLAGGDEVTVTDLESGTIRSAPFLLDAGYRRAVSAVVFQDGSLLVAGGMGYASTGTPRPVADVELFTPVR